VGNICTDAFEVPNAQVPTFLKNAPAWRLGHCAGYIHNIAPKGKSMFDFSHNLTVPKVGDVTVST